MSGNPFDQFDTGYDRALKVARANVQANNAGMGDVGRAIRSAGQGTLLGFGDELNGLAAGAMTGVQNFAANNLGIGKAAPYSMADAAKATQRATSEDMAQFHQRQPLLDTGLQLAGGLATPGLGEASGFIQGGRGLAQVAGRSALIGAGVGAVAGAGNAEGGLMDRAGGAVAGGLAGAALGAATPVVVGGLAGAAGRISGAVRNAADDLTQLRTGQPPEVTPLVPGSADDVAAQQRALGYVDDLRARSGKSVDDLAANPIEAAGKPITGAEALGRSGMYQLGAIGRMTGTTADTLEGDLGNRLGQRGQRLLGDFQEHFGVDPQAAQGDINSIVENGQANAKPLFDAAVNNVEGPVWNTNLSRLVQTNPKVRGALATVINNTEEAQAAGIRLDPDTGLLNNGTNLKDAVEWQPTAQTWDATKKVLGRSTERDAFGRPLPNSASQFNFENGQADQKLTRLLAGDNDVQPALPGYRDALDASGDYLSQKAAFDRAQTMFLNSATPADQFSNMVAKASPAEQQAMKAGVANALFNQAQNGRLKPGTLMTPIAQAKATALFGEDGVSGFNTSLGMERTLDKGYRMIPGTNSVTGEVGFSGQDMQNGLADGAAKVAESAILHGPGAAVGRAARLAVGAVLSPARGALTPIDTAARDHVGALLQLKPSELAQRLRDFRSITPQGPGISNRLARASLIAARLPTAASGGS